MRSRQIFGQILCYIWAQHCWIIHGMCFKCLHRTLRNCHVTLLLAYSPCCSFTCQTFSVGINKPPWLVNKLPNDFSRAHIQDFLCTGLHLCKIVFRVLPVMVFTPSQILRDDFVRVLINHFFLLTISMGLSSQWNFGKKRHLWPVPLIKVSSIDSWFAKSSCCERSGAMQQFWLSNGHTGAHFAFKCMSLNPCSSRTAFKPFCCPDAVAIFCGYLRKRGSEFDWGILVSRCFPLLDLFI